MHTFLQTIANGAAKPAGGAETAEVALATGGALTATIVLFTLGMAHRAGRTNVLRGAADRVSKATGLPPWAALPVEIASLSLLTALVGMYWDISLHIDDGRDAGPLANPAHYLILVGLFGVFAAGFLAVVLPEERPSRAAVRLGEGWYAPVGGLLLLLCGSFSLAGFPLDDVWHRLFGQDVTLWGPTHLMLIGGAGLSLLGQAALVVEAGRSRQPRDLPGGLLGTLARMRHAAFIGALLVGLSTFQAEFDFGVPQFRLMFQPVLIAVAASIALVTARIYAGRGGALIAVAWFLAIRGGVALIVGPGFGETLPHFPLYVAEALIVEAVALVVAADRTPYRFGAIAGLLVGTLGTAAEWGWSHVFMPIAWPAELLPDIALAVPVAAVAGGLIGGFVGTALAAPRRERPLVPSLVPAAAGLVAIAAVVGYGLNTRVEPGVSATVELTEERPAPEREVSADIRIAPAAVAEEATLVNVTAWQGGAKLVVDELRRVGPGRYRTTEPIPVHGEWKAILRFQRDDSIAALPIYMPADPAIPAEAVPASARFERAFGSEKRLLQRELKQDVSSGLTTAAYLAVLAIALALIAGLGWMLARLARTAREREAAAA